MKKVVLCGIGGQGILLASSIIGNTLTSKDIPVVVSEVHGMAQRGGEVVSTMSMGGYRGAIAGLGEADVLVGFEPGETYKRLSLVSKEGVVITNTCAIEPPTVFLGLSKYSPVDELIEKMRTVAKRVVAINANDLAYEAGSIIAANIVLLGALARTGVLPVSREDMIQGIKERVPPKFLELNLKAFELGYKAAGEQLEKSN